MRIDTATNGLSRLFALVNDVDQLSGDILQTVHVIVIARNRIWNKWRIDVGVDHANRRNVFLGRLNQQLAENAGRGLGNWEDDNQIGADIVL